MIAPMINKVPTFSNKPKFKQINCTESRGSGLDLRQAEAILTYRPDIVLLEYPCNSEPPDMPFNAFAPRDKPDAMVHERIKDFPAEVLEKDSWVAADSVMWRNIAQLWSEGHQVLTYPTDGPSELTSEWREVWDNMYPQATKNWVWWVQIYLRERLMAHHIRYVLDKHSDMQKPTVMVYLERFHWIHVKFLLSEPSRQDIWDYYFGRFREVDQTSIADRIGALNPVFYRYWQEYSDFVK